MYTLNSSADMFDRLLLFHTLFFVMSYHVFEEIAKGHRFYSTDVARFYL